MSEYQYYEFQTIDRPLDAADRAALRAVSTRARITATSFTNSYQWGSFKGDPAQFMARWFDLHLYFANWGARRLMVRLPQRLVDRHRLDRFLAEAEGAEVLRSGENLILDIARDGSELEDALGFPGAPETEEEDDDSAWLAAMAPLRADVLAGDLRLFYLVWLMAVEADALAADDREPLPGIGPLTGAHEAFAEFFGLDVDLLQAAAERSPDMSAPSPDAARNVIAAMGDAERTETLVRLVTGDPHVAGEVRAMVRDRLTATGHALAPAARTVGDLRARAGAIRRAREKADAAKAAAEQRRKAQEAENARRARLIAIASRGEGVWREIETEIARRNASGYDRAASLLGDLQALTRERGTLEDFARRLRAIRERHAGKGRFIERLTVLG